MNLERITNLLIILQQGKQKTEMCGIIPNLVRTCGFFLCRHHSIPTGVLDSPWQASLWLERGGTSRQIHSQFAEGAHLEHIQISACKDMKASSFSKTFFYCVMQDLDEAMKKSTARWKIVVGHHTMRSVSEHGDTEELLKLLLPVLKVTFQKLFSQKKKSEATAVNWFQFSKRSIITLLLWKNSHRSGQWCRLLHQWARSLPGTH